ncbi:MAG: tRNA pseudouridine(38-40) synthase TruA [Candidatus Omnitrophica bacterium]|nr:tRNA pseudouridine(38-40) synthase TruA [Candidatus Omnitrophota bacterium]
MPNTCLTIAYDGTRYAGWQIQKNAITIQEEIEKALKAILKEKVRLVAAGRTDSGVHAKAQVANFKAKKNFRPEKLQAALNSKLPKDMSIIKAKKVPVKFHSQFDAKSKLYRYTILSSRIDDPFLKPYYYKTPYKLNIQAMKKEAKVLLGKHDFKSFQAKSSFSRIKSTVRTIKRIAIKKEKEFIHIDVEANGFLHNMVRNIVGTLIEIGRGYLPEGSMEKILYFRDRRKAGPTAHSKGLTLVRVRY